MGKVIQIGFAIVLFLLALRCLFVKVDDDPPPRAPDAVDKAAYQLIFRSDPPPPPRRGLDTRSARVLGFLLFLFFGVALMVNALR